MHRLRYDGTKLAGFTLAGVFVGAMFGRALGLGLRSDSVPFFILLGAVVGIVLGFAMGYFLEHRPGTESRKKRSR